MLLLVLTVSAVLLVMSATMDLGLSVAHLAAAGVGLWLFGGAFGTLAFAVGAATGRRGVALGVASGAAVMAYLFAYLGPLVDAGWMESVSPYGWYTSNEPLTNGFDWPGLGLLAALAVLLVGAGLARFVRRDLMV